VEERHSVDELVTMLGELVTEAWSMPLSGGKVVVDKSRVLDLVEEIKAVMPGDFQQARAIVASRNELANAARRDADAIIRAAEERAASLIAESAITKEAKRVSNELREASIRNAKEILANAEAQARTAVENAEAQAASVLKSAESKSRELRHATSAFIEDALAKTEETLATSLNELRRVKQQFKQNGR